MPGGVTRKWRPGLWAVVLLVLGLVLCLPFAGLMLFGFYANQLVQQTEESLMTQASVLSSVYAELYREETGSPVPASTTTREVAPLFPSLSLNEASILPPRPDARPMTSDPDDAYLRIGPRLSRIADDAQVQTLAGYRMLDPGGNVIAGSAEVGLSLAHIEEIRRGLAGETVSVARFRIREDPTPFVYAFSLGTRVRVNVAMPVEVDDRVIGAVYVSRTPSHIFRFLYGERFNLARAALFVLVSTGLIGFVFWRFITGPIHSLIRQTDAMGDGADRWQPPGHYGTREIANLAGSFASLTERLRKQKDALRTYTAHVTHELKSPLTAVKGAAELMREEDMSADERARFLDNIRKDTTRMEALLASMREFSLVEETATPGTCRLSEVTEEIARHFPGLAIRTENPGLTLPLHRRSLMIVLKHLLENAAEHGASNVTLAVETDDGPIRLTVGDDGAGISEGNRERVLQPFFTTRRDKGGTGLGLNIVKAVVEASGGRLDVEQTGGGARFIATFGPDLPRARR